MKKPSGARHRTAFSRLGGSAYQFQLAEYGDTHTAGTPFLMKKVLVYGLYVL
jgi:hypothetical protein